MIKIKSFLKKALIAYFIYIVVFMLLIFKLPVVVRSNLNYNVEDMLIASNANSHAYLVEDTDEAMDIRLALIEEAKESIDVAYYKYLSDKSGEIFSGALLKKADAGIKVRITIDGLKVIKDRMFKILSSHENITYQVYEPMSLIFVHRNNNVLHDKILLIDENYGLIGGRNIDKRFLFSDNKTVTLDRDVLVYSTDLKSEAGIEMKEYFNEISESKYIKTYNNKYKDSYNKDKEKMITMYETHRENGYDLRVALKDSVAVDKVSFIRSPLNRMTKEPVHMKVIEDLIKLRDTTVIQSPYITKSYLMNLHFDMSKNKNITILTNNMNTNPNIPSLTGYIRIRKDLAKDYNLYELQNENSIHAKTVTIGDDISIIGSLNMDHRSIFLSTESSVIIYSKEFQKVLNVELDNLFDQSLLVNGDGSYVLDKNITKVSNNIFKRGFVRFFSWISAFFNEMLLKFI